MEKECNRSPRARHSISKCDRNQVSPSIGTPGNIRGPDVRVASTLPFVAINQGLAARTSGSRGGFSRTAPGSRRSGLAERTIPTEAGHFDRHPRKFINGFNEGLGGSRSSPEYRDVPGMGPGEDVGISASRHGVGFIPERGSTVIPAARTSPYQVRCGWLGRRAPAGGSLVVPGREGFVRRASRRTRS
jgi:hypothetical protein